MNTKQYDFKTPFGRIMLESNELFRRNAKGRRENFKTLYFNYIFNHSRRIARHELTESQFKETLEQAKLIFTYEP